MGCFGDLRSAGDLLVTSRCGILTCRVQLRAFDMVEIRADCPSDTIFRIFRGMYVFVLQSSHAMQQQNAVFDTDLTLLFEFPSPALSSGEDSVYVRLLGSSLTHRGYRTR